MTQVARIGAGARIAPRLGGVPETLLWPLRSRAGMTVLDRGFFDDPMAVDLLNRIDYDFDRFGPVSHWHAVRSKYSDGLIRRYLVRHPEAQVLALGEGLETQFWRLDNGRLRWLCVDLPESIALRRQLLPDHPRLTELPLSALDPAVFEAVDPARGLFVTAAGLVMYFTAEETLALLRRIGAHRGPSPAEIFFDTIPHWFSRRTLRGMVVDKDYTAPQMPFALARRDVPAFLRQVPGLSLVTAIGYGEAFPERSRLIATLGRLPVVRDMAPLLLHARFG